jgi:hypothetical protein
MPKPRVCRTGLHAYKRISRPPFDAAAPLRAQSGKDQGRRDRSLPWPSRAQSGCLPYCTAGATSQSGLAALSRGLRALLPLLAPSKIAAQFTRTSPFRGEGGNVRDVNEPPIGIIIGEQQSPKMGPRSFGIGPADHHELLAVSP